MPGNSIKYDVNFNFFWSIEDEDKKFTVKCENKIGLKSGDVYLLLGKSGSGKTSLLESITGYRTYGNFGGIFFNFVRVQGSRRLLLALCPILTLRALFSYCVQRLVTG